MQEISSGFLTQTSGRGDFPLLLDSLSERDIFGLSQKTIMSPPRKTADPQRRDFPRPVVEKMAQMSTKASDIVVSPEEQDVDMTLKRVQEELAGIMDALQQMHAATLRQREISAVFNSNPD